MSNFNIQEYQSTSSEELVTLNLTEFSTEELKKGLAKSLEITAKHLLILGRIWRELEDRGEDLSHLKTGLARYLPLIGEGKIAPDIVIKFAGQQLLLKEVALLPIEEQMSLAKGTKIPFVTQNPSGDVQCEFLPLDHLHARHYSQIFDAGHIRTEDEQTRLLKGKRQNKRRNLKIRSRKVTIDNEKKAIVCGSTKVLVTDIVRAFADQSGKSKEEVASFLDVSHMIE